MNATRSKRFSAFLALSLSCGLTVSAAPPVKPATVADLTVQMAVALGFEAPTPVEARETLLRAGIDLGSDLSTPLTRERANDLLLQLGVSAGSPADPKGPVSVAAVNLIARTASGALMATPQYPRPEALPVPRCFGNSPGECQSCCAQQVAQITLWPRTLMRLCVHTCVATSTPSPSGP
jgi:hypothetical protein